MRKFIDATFLAEDRSIVEVLWEDGEGTIYPEIVEVNPHDKTYVAFLEEAEINFDDIIDRTAEKNKAQRREFEFAAIMIGQQEGWIPKEEASAATGIEIKTERQIREDVFTDLNDMIFSKEPADDRAVKEFMFMTKLWIFDHPKVVESDNKELKQKVRRAKTPYEMMKSAIELLED